MQQIQKSIQKVLNDLGLKKKRSEIHLERPQDETHGDWATNVAMTLSKELKKSPREIAEDIKVGLEEQKDLMKTVEKIEIAGPGFINFTFSKDYYLENLQKINDTYGHKTLDNPQKIIVEYGQPNTHKLPHIGHLFSYIVGNSFARILNSQGHEIKEANYQGDVGPHVAKCLYAWIKKGRPRPDNLKERVQLLQKCYQEGSAAYEESEDAKREIQEINKKIYDKNSDIQEDWQETRQWSLDFYRQFEKELGVNQEYFYLESQTWKSGQEIVKENIGKVFKESEGAIVFPGEDYGLHTRVFITQKGTPTYEAKDVGLVFKKFEDWNFDKTVITTASEQNAYFDVITEAIEQINPEFEGKIKHVGFGMISLKSGKMSSRKGKILSAPQLVEVVKEKLEEIIAERGELSDEEKSQVVERVALGAIKYAFLKGNIMQNKSFDLEESISFEGNSGPYLQYTYARIQSVLSNAPKSQRKLEGIDQSILTSLDSEEELNLIKWLERFPETVSLAAEELSPHYISTYLFELAQRFNIFYKQHSINSADSEELITARQFLARQTAQVLKNALNLLGIEVVDKM